VDIWSGAVAGLVLVLLWTLEASAPLIAPPRPWVRQRGGHLVLGALNVLVSTAVVALLVVADAGAETLGFGALRWIAAPLWAEYAAALVVLDLWHYASHVVAHHVPGLWRFHAVHHNADRLEATVAMRFHMLEIAWMGLMMIPFAIVMGISVEQVAAYNLVLAPASMFHHANVSLPARLERVLGVLIVTPRMHRVHHSRWTPETDSNYGAVLPVWDRLFGTYRTRANAEAISVGLDGYEEREIREVAGMLLAPFGGSVSGYGEGPGKEEPRARARGS
jgi:sterol desaturase/sphingolipid hydroxylase (fatty acid hydroxylase superfamily)